MARAGMEGEINTPREFICKAGVLQGGAPWTYDKTDGASVMLDALKSHKEIVSPTFGVISYSSLFNSD